MRSLLLLCILSSFGFFAKASGVDLIFDQAQVRAHASWSQAPSTQDEARLHLEFRDPSDQKITEPVGTLSVALFMPEMGHGSAPTQVDHPAPGVFDVSNIYFLMPGTWEVRVTLTHDDTEETRRFTVDIEGALSAL